VRIAVHPHPEPEPYHLPHQALWFVVMLLILFLLAGKIVAAAGDTAISGAGRSPATAQCVIA